jgi:mono/diheme cytochrome c family protein
MHTIPLLKQMRRARLVWPCVITALGFLTAPKIHAQDRAGSLRPSQTTASETNPAREISQSQAAMTLVLAGVTQPKPAPVAATPASTNEAPTYLRDILPIFMGKCSRCHNEEARFVYNWLDYKTAFADRWEIRRRIWDSWKGTYYKEAMPIANSPESLALTEAERQAIINWVASGAARGVTPPPGSARTKAEKVELGRKMFASVCAACHQPTGQGLPNVFPPLAGSDFLNADKKRAIKIVINGRQGEVIVNGMKFNNSMPSFPLSDQDIANVLTFVYNSFGNSGLEVNPEEVKTLRTEPPDPSGPPPVKNPNEPNPFE